MSLGSPPEDLRFSAISSGRHTCAVTKSGVPYCWGAAGTYREAEEQEDYEAERQAFDRAMRSSKPGEDPRDEYIKKRVPARGVMAFSSSPRRVRTPVRFVSISVGILHTCALTSDGAAYCWGSNEHGELGNGSKDDSLVPIPVAGGMKFRSVVAGDSFTCGITAASAAYCCGSGYTIANQGDDEKLFVGQREYLDVLQPHPILTKVKLRSISIDRLPSGQALGTESLVDTDGALLIAPGCCANPPEGIPPNTQFLSADGGCGLTAAEKVVCFAPRLKTSPASGSLFQSVSAFDDGACAVTKEGALYCWGVGEGGELGPVATGSKAEPPPVSGNLIFQAVSRGDLHTCGLSRDGEAYCWGTLPNHAIKKESWFRYGPMPVKITAR